LAEASWRGCWNEVQVVSFGLSVDLGISFYALFVSWVEAGAKYDILGDALLLDGADGNLTDLFEVSDVAVVNASVHLENEMFQEI
jgi:hypothetical protein